MQYLLLIYSNESAMPEMTEAEQQANLQEWFQYTDDLKKAGVYVAGEALQSVSTATSVRLREGETIITDGPFAETKEQLGGFYMIDTNDIDDALKWAAKCPGARHGTMEVRPVMSFDQ